MMTALIVTSVISGCQKAPKPWQWEIPEGFPEPVVPVQNPMTPEKVRLGRFLFYDKNLSANRTQSCGSCHQQKYAFSDNKVRSIGSTGEMLTRNSMALVNVAYNSSLTWAHSGLKNLEQQILIPMFSEEPVELGMTGAHEQILLRFDSDIYQPLFAEAFPGEPLSIKLMVQAITSFVRSLTSFNSPFDRYAYEQQDDALSESAIRGMELFFSERLECHHCHGGFNFSQSSKHDFQEFAVTGFHNTGLYNEDGQGSYPLSDTGLIQLTLDTEDMGRFKAPTLRNVAVTAPYMHDGSVANLEEVLTIYAAGGRGAGVNSPLKSPFIHGFRLTPEEQQDLLDFLHSLTDQKFLTDPKHSDPWLDNSSY